MIRPSELDNRAHLTPRQAEAVAFVEQYRQLCDELPPARLVAKKLDVSRMSAFRLLNRAQARTRGRG